AGAGTFRGGFELRLLPRLAQHGAHAVRDRTDPAGAHRPARVRRPAAARPGGRRGRGCDARVSGYGAARGAGAIRRLFRGRLLADPVAVPLVVADDDRAAALRPRRAAARPGGTADETRRAPAGDLLGRLHAVR